jgi:hypothetical protein
LAGALLQLANASNPNEKEVKTMKYETPELTALTAINAIQQTHPVFKAPSNPIKDSSLRNDVVMAYADWE